MLCGNDLGALPQLGHSSIFVHQNSIFPRFSLSAFRVFPLVNFLLFYRPQPVFCGENAISQILPSGSNAVFLGFRKDVTNAIRCLHLFSRRKRHLFSGILAAHGHWTPFNGHVFGKHGRDI
jgi:hypothetical protein